MPEDGDENRHRIMKQYLYSTEVVRESGLQRVCEPSSTWGAEKMPLFCEQPNVRRWTDATPWTDRICEYTFSFSNYVCGVCVCMLTCMTVCVCVVYVCELRSEDSLPFHLSPHLPPYLEQYLFFIAFPFELPGILLSLPSL